MVLPQMRGICNLDLGMGFFPLYLAIIEISQALFQALKYVSLSVRTDEPLFDAHTSFMLGNSFSFFSSDHKKYESCLVLFYYTIKKYVKLSVCHKIL